MGTRNLTMVYVGGEYKVAQYGQWDGYPDGQGVTILKFLRSSKGKKKSAFIEKVEASRFLTDEESEEQWVKSGAEPKSNSVGMDVSEKHKKLYPESSRDTGAKILEIIAERGKGIGLQNKLEFVKDSLFCEWAYVVDFDAKTFEVYQGYNQTPLGVKERFATFADPVKQEYYPVRLLVKFDLNKLPTQKGFLDICKKLIKE